MRLETLRGRLRAEPLDDCGINEGFDKTPRISPMLLTMAVAAASGMSINAWAEEEAEAAAREEDAEAMMIEEIVVTGFRGSLMDAMRLKMNSEQIIEAISAEDIGKLPDNSIAESLARLPGLAGQRINGRQQVISIRGLSPDFSTALLNGMQQVSAGDNRGVEFDVYPSELLNRVVVYKTPDASLGGQGLSGTVDMQTVRPLEHGERTIAGNARYEWNDLESANPDREDSGHRVALSYIDQFADDTFGVALGYAGISAPTQGEVLDVWGYSGNPTMMTGAAAKAQSTELERDGLMGVFEYRPNEQVRHILDVYYSDLREDRVSREFTMPLFPAWFGTQLGANSTVDDGIVTDGYFSNVKAVIGNNLDTRDAELTALGWTSEVDINDEWYAEFQLNHSSIDRQDTILQTTSGTGPLGSGATDSFAFTIDGDGVPAFTGLLNYTDPGAVTLTSPQGWGAWGSGIAGGQTGYINRPAIEDELTQLRAAARRELQFGAVTDVQFGIQYDERSKSKVNSDQGFLGFEDGSLAQSFDPSGIVNSPFGLPQVLTYDPESTYDRGIYYLVDNLHSGVLSGDWEVDEEVLMAFVRFGLESSIGGVPVTGNIGIQVVNTDQNSSGSSISAGDTRSNRTGLVRVPYSDGTSYTEYLPSLSLNFEVGEGKLLRLGIARTLARARMDDMRASRDVSFNANLAGSSDPANSPWGGGGGNPLLEPWISNQIDLSYEHYFSQGQGYWALAVFYKDLDTYIYNESVLVDFSDYPTPAGVTPVLSTGFVSRPSNGDGGEIEGVEFTFSMVGEMISPMLTGFGVILNASFTDSEIVANPNDPSMPLPGLSEDVANFTLYYERYGFQARVSTNYRSDFLGEVAGFGAARNNRSIKEEELVDAQISYTFETGRLQGLTVYLQGTNLTDQSFSSYINNNERLTKDYQVYGRTFFLGASYRL